MFIYTCQSFNFFFKLETENWWMDFSNESFPCSLQQNCSFPYASSALAAPYPPHNFPLPSAGASNFTAGFPAPGARAEATPQRAGRIVT